MKEEIQELRDIANKLRIHCVAATSKIKSGHPTSCSSIAEIMAVLFFKIMKYKVTEPRNPANDRFVLSKGHAAPILYAAWAEVGFMPIEMLLSLRSLYSDLEGHPTPRLKFVDVATGSPGQGLSCAVGMAYVGKRYDQANYRVFCIVGDGECAEGAVWEALNFASFYKLNNLCVVVDVNRFGQTCRTTVGHDMDVYRNRFESFGAHTLIVDGHDVEELICAFECAERTNDKLTVIAAKTTKGKYFPTVENVSRFHGKSLDEISSKVLQHLQSLIVNKGSIKLHPPSPTEDLQDIKKVKIQLSVPPDYSRDAIIATRSAYGTALRKLAQNFPQLIALDADSSDSTCSERLRNYDSDRFVECFSSHQNMVGVAIGAACRSRTVPFVSTFGAFLTRAFDQIRMGAISRANVKFCGSHCGISAGRGGPSQMALEDIAMFRAIPGCTIFYPSDAVSCERAVELSANTNGITYIRTTKPPTAIIYPNDKTFRIGEANVLRKHDEDRVLVISSGITLTEALKAEEQLTEENIKVRVMDLFTVQPIDKEGILLNAKECDGRILTVEDHYAAGGVGEAVLAAVAQEVGISVKVVAVPKIPKSGDVEELLDYFGISASNIILYIKQLLSNK